MDHGFYNRHDWWTLAAAMAVWTAHFTLLWSASIIFPGHSAARWLAGAFTIAAFVALAWLYLRAKRPSIASVPGLGLALAAAGTLFDSVPPLIA
jgi:hypothetical protein